jgi:amidase
MEGTSMPAIRVSNDKAKLHYVFSTETAPVATANPGDAIIFECVDAYCNQIKDEQTLFSTVDRKLNNPATGPVYVNGAEVGDVLKVSIQRIDPAATAVMTARPHTGLYGELIPEYQSKIIPIRDNKAYFTEDIILELKPMIGVIGTAPGSPAPSTWPGEHGGNLDCKDLTAGSTIYLPVNVKGALLSMGDLHGVQGDGETVICALEMDGEITVTVEVLKQNDIPTPFILTPTHYVTLAAAHTLEEAGKAAAFKMHEFLLRHSNLSIQEVAMLLSLQGNLRITQVVNPLMGCCMDFPRGLINEKVSLDQ